MSNEKPLTTFEKYCIYISFILVGVIGLLHQATGYLGQFIFFISNFLFGYLGYLIFVLFIVYGIMMILKKKIKFNKLFIACFIVLIAASLILSIIQFNKEVGFAVIKTFFASVKDMFTGLTINKCGLFGCLLYALISKLINLTGTIIIIVVLLLVAGTIIFVEYRNKSNIQPIFKPNKINFLQMFKNKKPKIRKEKIQIEEKPIVKPDVIKPIDSTEKFDDAYKKPDYSLILENSTVVKKSANERNAREKWAVLKDSLDSFGLPSSIEAYNIGPSVTQFQIVPDGNFNIRKYATIEENIKMDLAVKDIRIEAPIPGKKAVGIEIPNVERIPVKLKELLNAMPKESSGKPLTVGLGKDLTGTPIYSDIDKMPHLLIAGATGSGKSVCINSIILTILLRTRPEEVKLLLVDPKKVEFASYKDVPHLLSPIIDDNSKASKALEKLVQVMEDRYTEFQKAEVKNISDYNLKNPAKKMYRIVCIIDELADLMATNRKDVENYIQRLSSKARASGIYLILATQRPSTDVITGVIKANIPSRIAFAVSSIYDSRTILDTSGAETLFGNGDMLYAPAGAGAPIRVQGVYCSENEINKCIEYFKKCNYLPKYNDVFVLDDQEDGETSVFGEAKINDPYYQTVKQWVVTQKTCSASMLQRKFGLGFPRAAKMIDALQQDGIISESNGSKPRTVLVEYDPSIAVQQDD